MQTQSRIENRGPAHDTRWMVTIALLAAIILVMSFTPLGLIPLPFIKASTLQIPVIIGAILLGPLAGGILGAVFGICSMINNTIAPTAMSFAFSPALASGPTGAVKAIWIAVGCRIMIGVIAGWLWVALSKTKLNQFVALPITGFVGAMTNTVFVMGSIYLLLAGQYAATNNQPMAAVFGLIMGVVGANGVPEAIISAVLVTIIGKALLTLFKQSKRKNK